jgi:hypothetical protein
MKEIRIKKVRENYFVVIASSERFGADEIMFEGISLEECTEWIKANTKPQKKALWAVMVECKTTRSIKWIVVRSQDSWTAFNRVWRMGFNNGYWFGKGIRIA